jgi:hypothetical protein
MLEKEKGCVDGESCGPLVVAEWSGEWPVLYALLA